MGNFHQSSVYYTKAGKSWLIVKKELHEKTIVKFKDTQIKIASTVKRHESLLDQRSIKKIIQMKGTCLNELNCTIKWNWKDWTSVCITLQYFQKLQTLNMQTQG